MEVQNLVDEFAAAKFLGISASMLRKDRASNDLKIPTVKIGRAVRYSLPGLQNWVQSRMVNGQGSTVQFCPSAPPPPGKRGPGRPRRVLMIGGAI